jgi:hypothetical protein
VSGTELILLSRSNGTVAQVCLRRCMCIFAMSVVCTKRVSWAPMHASVHIPVHGVFDTTIYICDTITVGCARALVFTQFFHWHLGTRVGGFNKCMQSTCCLAWVIFLTDGKIEMLSCVFSIFDARWQSFVCTCNNESKATAATDLNDFHQCTDPRYAQASRIHDKQGCGTIVTMERVREAITFNAELADESLWLWLTSEQMPG